MYWMYCTLKYGCLGWDAPKSHAVCVETGIFGLFPDVYDNYVGFHAGTESETEKDMEEDTDEEKEVESVEWLHSSIMVYSIQRRIQMMKRKWNLWSDHV